MALDALAPAWWPHAVALASLLVTALQRHSDGYSAGCRAALALGPRAVMVAWLLGGLLARSAEVRLLCALLLASGSRVPRRELYASLALLLARLVACGDGLASVWLPCFLVLQGWLLGEAATALPSSKPSFPFLPSRTRSRSISGLDEFHDQVVKRFPNWTPPMYREEKAYTKMFGLHSPLLAVYDCTVHLNMQHQGYLYLSRTHICFHAVNLMARGIQFAISLEDVKEVLNGGSRDRATLVLKRAVQIRDRSLTRSSIELRGCESGVAAIAALLEKKDESEDDSEDLTDSAAEGETSKNVPNTPPPNDPNDNASRALATFNSDGEPFRSLFEAHIPGLRLGQLGEELLNGDWTSGHFLMQHLAKQGAMKIAPAAWIDDTGNGGSTPSQSPVGGILKLREVTMEMPVPPAPMCPKETRMTTTFCIKVSLLPDGDASIELQTSSMSHDVPFGDKFLVQELVKLEPSQGGTSFRKSGRVVFLKSCGLFTSRIRSSSANQCTVTAEMMATLLQARAFASSDATPSSAPRTTCKVEIYELQRRVTVWSNKWIPPFLPHDGRKRWRWTDTTYQVHAWNSAQTREEAQASTYPPIQPQGWDAQGEWDVRYPTSGDPEGWQYAIDFYHKDRYWGNSPAGCSVRRRLWHCTFLERSKDD